ncbi:hypothetical protein [Caballeronia zhejiangensis]|uniref:hypothetical protein n=1 Tax=Caballeronia zhejiangensis TaxID=871203 RepID=UPI001FCFFCD8|nr:hypothetical protein [Caballeronia zhejiangensis]
MIAQQIFVLVCCAFARASLGGDIAPVPMASSVPTARFLGQDPIDLRRSAHALSNWLSAIGLGISIRDVSISDSGKIISVYVDIKEDYAFLVVDFERQYGTSIWERIIQKTASLLQVASTQVVIHAQYGCLEGVAYRVPRKIASMHWLSACGGASGSAPLRTANHAAISGKEALSASTVRLNTKIISFLAGELGTADNNITRLSLTPDYVEVIVRGLKGRVIHGGKQWERLQITVFITEAENHGVTLRAIVDGRLASGLGAYPADSQFTQDMEPAYSEDLSNFTKQLTTSIRDYIDSANRH